jgi:hypothetical protein
MELEWQPAVFDSLAAEDEERFRWFSSCGTRLTDADLGAHMGARREPNPVEEDGAHMGARSELDVAVLRTHSKQPWWGSDRMEASDRSCRSGCCLAGGHGRSSWGTPVG